MIETWLWEKEQSHRLFNFHEGYRILTDGGADAGTEVIGSKIIRKAGANDVHFQQASEYFSYSEAGENDSEHAKLVNIIYHKGKYFLYEPRNENENSDNIIDNHLWLIMKFMPRKCHDITIGDVVRFGRIPFKVCRMVLNVEKEKLEQVQR